MHIRLVQKQAQEGPVPRSPKDTRHRRVPSPGVPRTPGTGGRAVLTREVELPKPGLPWENKKGWNFSNIFSLATMFPLLNKKK